MEAEEPAAAAAAPVDTGIGGIGASAPFAAAAGGGGTHASGAAAAAAASAATPAAAASATASNAPVAATQMEGSFERLHQNSYQNADQDDQDTLEGDDEAAAGTADGSQSNKRRRRGSSGHAAIEGEGEAAEALIGMAGGGTSTSTSIPSDIEAIYNENPEFYGALLKSIHGNQKDKKLDAFAAHDIGNKDAGNRYVQQMEATPNRRTTMPPKGIKNTTRGGRPVPRKVSTRLSGDGEPYEVVSLHRVDPSYWKGKSMKDLLCDLRDLLCRHRATVLDEVLEPGAVGIEERDITDEDDVWTILEPFVESLRTYERRKIVFLQEKLLQEMPKYVKGGKKAFVSGLTRVVWASIKNKVAFKVGSCNQDASY